jgi:FkbM family methyltransferase
MNLQKLVKLYKILYTPLFFRALLKGTAAGVEHRRVLQDLDCRHVVDIGANRGQFALIARKCFPRARIDSFEPLVEPGSIYRSVFEKDKRIYLHSCAIGPEAGKAIIHVSRHDDSSSLLPISALQESLFPGTAEKETRTIDVCPLDEVLTAESICSPALLKLDVQGYEIQALQGCESLLHCFAHVYVECSFVELYAGQAFADEVIAWLRGRGFILAGVYNMACDSRGKAVQADFMFSGRRA